MHDQRKNKILKQIENSVSDAVNKTAYSAYLLSKKINNKLKIGKFIVTRKKTGTYDISEKSGEVLYSDLYCADAAITIVECLIHNNIPAIKRVLTAEHEYYKQYLNVVQMKRALEKKYSPIYEDRYELAKERLSNALYKIRCIRKLY